MEWLLALVLSAAPTLPLSDRPYQSAETCPTTREVALPFVPPAPYPITPPDDRFWHGTAALWTMLDKEGEAWQLPARRDALTQKVFWWRPGFNGASEPSPEFILTVKRLDTGESRVLSRKATNASHATFGGSTILTGIKMPAGGCWEITGNYRGSTLSFTVWVAS